MFFLTVFSIDNNKRSKKRIISEGSCDTEDWNNVADNLALPS